MSARLVLQMLAATFLLSLARGAANEPELPLLGFDRGALVTTHRLAYRIDASEAFTRAGPKHRQAVFNDVPFEISLAAFVRNDAAVMVHAERVADKSGASDYTHFPEADWPDGRFRLKPPECLELPPEAIDGEHDLEWLRDNGFLASGTLHIEQYFASTADFNEELVISLLLKVGSCDDQAANRSAVDALRAGLVVTRTDAP